MSAPDNFHFERASSRVDWVSRAPSLPFHHKHKTKHPKSCLTHGPAGPPTPYQDRLAGTNVASLQRRGDAAMLGKFIGDVAMGNARDDPQMQTHETHLKAFQVGFVRIQKSSRGVLALG